MLQAEESAPCKHFPSLGRSCQGSPTPLAIWPEGPKGDTRRPRAGQPSPTRSDLTVQPQVPSVCACACACVCVCKRGHVGWGHSEQKQADEGPMSNRQVMFTPQVKPGWVGRGVRGLHPSAQALSRALQGMGHCVPGAGLCTHRSVSDLGAAGGLGSRTMGTAWQGCDASGPATGPCLCRRPRRTPRRSWWTRLPPQEQGQGITWEGFPLHPGHCPQ